MEFMIILTLTEVMIHGSQTQCYEVIAFGAINSIFQINKYTPITLFVGMCIYSL